MESSMINTAVVVALMLLAVSLTLLATMSAGVFFQLGRTLASVERLTDTTRDELGPTLKDVREVLEGVNQIRSITAARVNEVGHKVEDVAGSLTNVASSATKQSSVWGAGLIAGVRAYLAPKNHVESDGKQISMDRGEANELKQ